MTLFDVAACLARAWTHLYTWRLPADLASERSAELESDLWEMRHDADGPQGPRGALAVFARLIEGVADDLVWRLEQGPLEEQLFVRRLIAVAAAGALVIGVWTIPTLFAGGLRNVSVCATQVPAPESSADLRFELVRCTGAFFLARD